MWSMCNMAQLIDYLTNQIFFKKILLLPCILHVTQGLVLEGCINSTTCLSTTPKVTIVQRGTGASIYIDNAAYRSFIYNKFNVSPVDIESASVALICLQQRKSFIIIRAFSDLVGGGSADSNEADTFTSLAANNSVLVLLEFIKHLSNWKHRLCFLLKFCVYCSYFSFW